MNYKKMLSLLISRIYGSQHAINVFATQPVIETENKQRLSRILQMERHQY